MLRVIPIRMCAFAPSPTIDLANLIGGIPWRGRASLHALAPSVYRNDPLASSDTAPEPTDVRTTEPWDVPPPDPSDPRPKSIP